MWNKRYSSKSYAYGTKANDFLVSMIDRLPTGKILCLAEGEGRNADWLAEQGNAELCNDVTAVDASEIGLEFLHLQECVREIHEGEFHNGTGAVVQVLAKKL